MIINDDKVKDTIYKLLKKIKQIKIEQKIFTKLKFPLF